MPDTRVRPNRGPTRTPEQMREYGRKRRSAQRRAMRESFPELDWHECSMCGDPFDSYRGMRTHEGICFFD